MSTKSSSLGTSSETEHFKLCGVRHRDNWTSNATTG